MKDLKTIGPCFLLLLNNCVALGASQRRQCRKFHFPNCPAAMFCNVLLRARGPKIIPNTAHIPKIILNTAHILKITSR